MAAIADDAGDFNAMTALGTLDLLDAHNGVGGMLGETSELRDARTIFRPWELGEVISARAPELGAIHRTLLLTTTSGRYVVRGYRHRERAPVDREHALITYARAQRLPVPAPIPLPDGATILAHEGAYYALFPFASGVQTPRETITVRGAATMGAFLARLHSALAGFPPDATRRRSLAVSTRESLAEAVALDGVIRGHGLRDAVDKRAFARLHSQRRWLERQTPKTQVAADTALWALLALPQQLIHGDYQDSNLFFADDSTRAISAVLDWDPAYFAPRVWEVIRALDLVFALEPTRASAFVAAYRTAYRQGRRIAPWRDVDPLPLAHLDLAAEVYSWTRAHGFWIYWEVYSLGNDRCRRFIGPARFVPFAKRWQAMRHTLSDF